MNIKNVKGLSLVHVMVLMMLLGMILVAEIRQRDGHQDTRAYFFTTAQTNMVLNSAFGVFRDSGRWPHDAADDCAVTPAGLRNGWGAEVHCAFEPAGATPNDATGYRVIQYVPEHIGSRFVHEFEHDRVQQETNNPAHNPPPDFDAYSVRVNRHGGAEQIVDFVTLSGSASHPASAPRLDCPSGSTPESFVALGGMEAHVLSSRSVRHSLSFCAVPIDIDPPDSRLGFTFSGSPATPPERVNISYSMYRPGFNKGYVSFLTYVDLFVPIDGTHTVTDQTVNSWWMCSEFSNDAMDGHFNATHQAHGRPIGAALFQYCYLPPHP